MDGHSGHLAETSPDAESKAARQLPSNALWKELLERCRAGDDVSSVYETADALLHVKRKLNNIEKWRAVGNDEHFIKLREVLREDPFSNRAVTRPRGYPGDAVLLDMAYRIVTPPTIPASRLGGLAFEATTNSPGSRSVRARKKHVATFIDSVAADFQTPRIASVACGHLRELECSSAFQNDKLGEFLGIDQDVDSISVVKERFSTRRVTAHVASLKDFLRQRVDAGPFHGMYSVGLFDYLDDVTAAKATAAMFRMLKPGGRLLIANLSPSLGDIPYMEAVMDWWMTYRSPSQLNALARSVLNSDETELRTYADVLENVAFVEIRRVQ